MRVFERNRSVIVVGKCTRAYLGILHEQAYMEDSGLGLDWPVLAN